MALITFGNDFSELMLGTVLDEHLYGLGGNDTIYGGGGHDRLIGGAGADYLFGGSGTDTADYSASALGVTAVIGNLAAGGDAEGDYIGADIENLAGSFKADVLGGSDGMNVLTGNGGDDRLWGFGGDDWLYGGTGNDTITGGQGADYIDGGTGIDTASYLDSWEGVTVQIVGPSSVGHAFKYAAGGTAHGDYVTTTVENLEGSLFSDTLNGNDYANGLFGGAGNDTLAGREGDDTIVGGQGADFLIGDGGVDTVSYAGSAAGIQINLSGGYGIGGDAEGDYLFASFENATGTDFRDIIFGNAEDNFLFLGNGDDGAAGDDGDDVIYGGAGKDYIIGGAGDDDLRGDAGDDKLFGDAGDDRLIGGDGNDRLEGGDGADQFRFSFEDLGDTDRIVDFDGSEGDRINLSSIDANTGLAGNQAFVFVGMRGFSGTAGELHVVASKTGMALSGDVGGDGIADFSIILDNAPNLTATDFLL